MPSCPMAVIMINAGFFLILESECVFSITVSPSSFGITMSSRTTSGCFSRIRPRHISPFSAFPTTSISLSVLIISSKSCSIRSLSSAIAILSFPMFPHSFLYKLLHLLKACLYIYFTTVHNMLSGYKQLQFINHMLQ